MHLLRLGSLTLPTCHHSVVRVDHPNLRWNLEWRFQCNWNEWCHLPFYWVHCCEGPLRAVECVGEDSTEYQMVLQTNTLHETCPINCWEIVVCVCVSWLVCHINIWLQKGFSILINFQGIMRWVTAFSLVVLGFHSEETRTKLPPQDLYQPEVS
jgi:hypothetical protein